MCNLHAHCSSHRSCADELRSQKSNRTLQRVPSQATRTRQEIWNYHQSTKPFLVMPTATEELIDFRKYLDFVSIPKRVSEALKLGMDRIKLFVRIVSIPKRVSEALKHRHSPLSSQKLLFQSLKGFQRLWSSQHTKILLCSVPFQSLKGFQRLWSLHLSTRHWGNYWRVSIPKRVSEALKLERNHLNAIAN